jgi:uncharacterized protein YjgD (DUF1641 family)
MVNQMSNLETNQTITFNDLISNINTLISKITQVVLDLTNSLLIPSMNTLRAITNSIPSLDFLSQDPAMQEKMKSLITTQKNVLNSLIDFSNYLSDIVSNLLNSIMNSFKVSDLINYFNKILNYIKELGLKILNILKQVFNLNFLDAVSKFFENFMKSLSANLEKVSKSNGSISDILKLLVDQDFLAFMNIISPIVKAFGQAIRSYTVESQKTQQSGTVGSQQL